MSKKMSGVWNLSGGQSIELNCLTHHPRPTPAVHPIKIGQKVKMGQWATMMADVLQGPLLIYDQHAPMAGGKLRANNTLAQSINQPIVDII